MSTFMQKAALLGSFAASVYAHGRIDSITIDGQEYSGYTSSMAYSTNNDPIIAWSADNGDNGFVGPDSYGTSDIACHKNGKPGGIAAKVAAGGQITLQWNTWPESHHGPVLDYMAKCAGDDCSTVSPGDLSFFKIDQEGLNDAASNNWASDKLIADGNAWTVTVPESLAPGQYVLRHEIIALHSAQDTNGAQNYPQCINLEVTGSGSASPSGETAMEFYTATDPGISLNIYNGLTSYDIPGPAVWDGASSGSSDNSGSSPAPSSAAASSAAATSAAASPSYPAGNSTEAGPTATEAYPEETAAPTFAGDAPATTSPCTTTITLSGSAKPTATSAPIETSDNSSEDSSDDYESDDSSSDSESSPATTTSAASAPSSTSTSSGSSSGSSSSGSETAASYGKPSKALPEGFTLTDLLAWVNYLISKSWNEEGVHARDISARR
ncbi:hypothetical protein WHR41_06945 [Cladosporium halotolerans]|uniref:Auxiliary Activity family 9 catalytic domain-containing protein n=1 Tax=Cladosporium halotolerans TaxID=1052096 RepID=A0AB34KME6_9PEZI